MFDLLKLHLSAIFQRQPKYLIALGGNTLYYTKISPMELRARNYDSENAIHKVTFKNEKLFDSLKTVLPYIDKRGVFVNLKDLMLVLNKCKKTTYKRSELTTHDLSCYDDDVDTFYNAITIPNINKTSFDISIISDDLVLRKTVGTVETEHTVNMYEQLFNDFKPDHSLVKIIKDDDINKLDIIPVLTIHGINIPIVDGVTNVSVKEYVKKIKVPCTLQCFLWEQDLHFRTKMVFINEYIEVESIQPAMKFCKL